MNRLVLIGNGFDLTHGLNTSYNDFLEWYWGEWGKRLLYGQSKKESDGLCSFTLKDTIQLNSWSQVWGFHYHRKNPFEPWNPYEVLNVAKRSKDLCEFKFIGEFLERICNNSICKNWSGIESDYYSLLEKRIAIIKNYSEKEVESLNLQLDLLKTKLAAYLKQEQYKKIGRIDAIRDKIYRPIKENEISVSYKGILDKSVLGDVVPVETMLLNFNYTKTPEKYIFDKSKVKICYIHGNIDDPQSIIFGYGDELDDNYKKLQKLNENECLRHMKSIHYLESDRYRTILEFIEAMPFQVVIMGHSCGNSDRTLLNTIFEHKNCISIKSYFYINNEGKDNYLDIAMNISRNFTDMKLMRDRVVNKMYCETLT